MEEKHEVMMHKLEERKQMMKQLMAEKKIEKDK
jgi:hypothetical protein